MSAPNIGLHLKNIYEDGELTRGATTEESSVVQIEGGREFRRQVTQYNLDAILAVGYRVRPESLLAPIPLQKSQSRFASPEYSKAARLPFMSAAESELPLLLRSFYRQDDTEAFPHISENWSAWWVSFCDRLPLMPPQLWSAEERVILDEFGAQVRHLAADMALHSPGWFALNPQPGFEQLLEAEYLEGEPQLRLSVRLLTDAFRTLGKVATRTALLTNQQAHFTNFLARAAQGDLELDAASSLLLRLELDAFVAFEWISRRDVVRAPAWARSASISGRNVEAALDEIFASVEDQMEPGLERRIMLSARAARVVDDILDHPAEPTEALRALFRDHP